MQITVWPSRFMNKHYGSAKLYAWTNVIYDNIFVKTLQRNNKTIPKRLLMMNLDILQDSLHENYLKQDGENC